MSAVTIGELLGGLISLAQLFLKARAAGQQARFSLALDKIKQLHEATDEEIARAAKAHDIADSNPNAGRL